MPELPEVETTRRGLAPWMEGRVLVGAEVREPRLRYPVPVDLDRRVAGSRIQALRRRGKYLIVALSSGWLLVHLGMSGSLRLVPADRAPGDHDHIDLLLDSGQAARLTDPRRFGSVLWGEGDPLAHRLLARLGPEPLGEAFSGDLLYRRSRGRRAAVKAFLMDAGVVVGVGNIYANEALYRAGIRPDRPAGRVGLGRYRRLADAVREVLQEALEAGGTTLRDFTGGDGRPGYFAVTLAVYGGGACPGCQRTLRAVRLAQRSTWYCPGCQR